MAVKIKEYICRQWNHLPVRVKGIVALLLPIAALILNTALIIPIYSAQQSAQSWVAHTFAVRVQLEHIPAALANVTVNYRLYKLTHDKNALKAAQLDSAAVARNIDEVQSLTADNLVQQRRIPELRAVAAQRLKFLVETSLSAQPAPLDREIHSQILRQTLLGLIARMDKEEASLLAVRERRQEQAINRQYWAGGIALLIGIVSGIAGILLFLSTEGYIRRLNAVLEERVAQRTHELAEANEELEQFCSSVSHDLRAPLRSVEGFAKILVRDYEQTFDDRGRDALKRIRAATQRMGQLIEDLLKLSRIARADVSRQTADLSALAAAICEDLRASQPERAIEIEVEPGLTADADPRLVRVVLENLIGNAWKFTRKNESARITFGLEAAKGREASYYVRDNGAGFDMAFAEQLFVPFQRLHSAVEFEGSGVGLATVQRVIHRHHGQIWADSAPGRGATFFFTLGENLRKGVAER